MEKPMEFVHVHVSGKQFTLNTLDILAYPDSLLAKAITGNGKVESLTYRRPISPFKSVVSLYQTGELHMPPNICPKEFEKEMQFWGFDTSLLETCCYLVYKKFTDDHSKMLDFQREFTYSVLPISNAFSIRNRIWMVLDNQTSSLAAKIYLAVVIAFVTMSIITLCLATMPQFKEPPTKAELKQYVESAGTDYDILDILNIINNANDYDVINQLQYYYNYDYYDDSTNSTSNATDADKINHQTKSLISKLNLLSLKRKGKALVICEYIVLAFFSIELIARLMTCPSLCRYFRSVLNVLDALILIMAYAEVIVYVMNDKEKFNSKGIEILLYFQMLRIFRIIRIVKNVKAIKVLAFSFKNSYKDFLVLILYIAIALIIFGSIFYFVEDISNISSIPDAFWLTLITMTTVGYGDTYPKTGLGKLTGGFCALTGVLLLSLIIPVFVGTFISVYEYANYSKPQPTTSKFKKKEFSTSAVFPKVILMDSLHSKLEQKKVSVHQ